MAANDKTYIEGHEYNKYRKWWINNYDLMIKHLGTPIFMYPFQHLEYDDFEEITPEFLKKNKNDLRAVMNLSEITLSEITLWNTNAEVDEWLLHNCSILSFHEQMWEAYEPEDYEQYNEYNEYFRKMLKPN